MRLLPALNSIKQICDLEKLGANVKFSAENEELNPEDHFDNTEDVKYIIEQHEDGNPAAWFCAKVTVSYKDQTETEYLGCCSYNSFQQFTGEENGYYLDMINTCINEINRVIDSINFGIQRQWSIRRAKNILKPYDLFIAASDKIPTL